MSISQGLHDYFRACPLIDRKNRLNFNSLGAKPTEYSIDDEGPENPVIKTYVDGGSLRFRTFSLATRAVYGEDERVNISNSGTYEQLRAWVEEQNRLRRFPQMDEGQMPHRLEALTDGYLYTTDTNTARYQIQLRLTYYQKGAR